MVAIAVFTLFAGAAIRTWTTLETSALTVKVYAQRQNDQMRALDYVKRDIRRASNIDIYQGATLVTTVGTVGNELRVTLPIYYTDSRLEDDAMGASVANVPTLAGANVNYGATMIVRYYVLNGAVIRNEAGTAVTIGDAPGAFSLGFAKQASGEILSSVTFNQPVSCWNNRLLTRSVSILSGQRTQLH